MSYPYVASKWDYGPRTGPILGLMYHMAEGGGTVHYLSKSGGVQRGVSVHAVCDYNGIVTQMLPWSHASGSLNPADRSTDKAYYGHQHLVDVLGSWWTDPNSAVLSMEIEGFAAIGPNAKQVAAAIAWGLDMKAQFSSLVGALGHADQTNTKRCPGTTPAMQGIFEGVGGHGRWHPQSGPIQDGDMLEVSDETPVLVDAVKGVQLFDPAGKALVKVSVTQRELVSPFEALVGGGHYRATYVTTSGKNQLVLIHNPDANAHPLPAPPTPDCSGPVAAEHERTLKQAKDALEAIP